MLESQSVPEQYIKNKTKDRVETGVKALEQHYLLDIGALTKNELHGTVTFKLDDFLKGGTLKIGSTEVRAIPDGSKTPQVEILSPKKEPKQINLVEFLYHLKDNNMEQMGIDAYALFETLRGFDQSENKPN